MEDVLDVYHRPYDAECPVVCMDEKPLQLLGESREPIPMRPATETHRATPKRVDDEYERKGTCSIFMFTEPLTGFRHVSASTQRTKKDWAREIRYLLEEVYPEAPKVCLVMDNLNTHTLGSLYAAFAPELARSLAERLEIHYTPKHGSWLNIAEIELSVLTRQALNHRHATLEDLQATLLAWEQRRNAAQKSVDWQFSSDIARIRLKKLYPITSDN